MQRKFADEKRSLSFGEYLELLEAAPPLFCRDSVQYLKDVFDHWGSTTVEKPWGTLSRFKLFDLPWLQQSEADRLRLVGQEEIQSEVYRVLRNFAREGRSNRLTVLHGPNGSAKSTVAACMIRALEHYSSLDDGALYRFHWVFPTKSKLSGAIGFDRSHSTGETLASYAHLPEEEIDARLRIEFRDHPLFLLPRTQRRELLTKLYSENDVSDLPSQWLMNGELSHKNREIFSALLTDYDGDLASVLRHVQVERYFISKRYRCGAVTIGPHLSVDAGERQLTADRSVGALPTSLQSLTLYEAYGELIDASGGLLEFSDLFKRPLDAFKYLQQTIETGEFALASQNVQLNAVMIASVNEIQLAAFRDHHEFESFRGRFELVRAGYLRNYADETAIYEAQIVPQVGGHVAPHATSMAAIFAVLTRMRRPEAEQYGEALKEVISSLTVVEKMELYTSGATPERLDEDTAKLLRANLGEVYTETDAYPIYEGSIGASPREMRTVLLDAAQSERYDYLSPFAVLDQLDELCEGPGEFVWLQQEATDGGYHDHEKFRKGLRVRLLDALELELRGASGIVDEGQYHDMFDRYVHHVSFAVKGEKVLNEHTGSYEEPDESLMAEVETLIGTPDSSEQFRNAILGRIAAWAIENPGQKVDNQDVFRDEIRRIKNAVFKERSGAVAKLCRDLVVLVRDDATGLDDHQREAAERALSRLKSDFAYQDSSAADAAAVLVSERYSELL
ncbi:MAG: serine protein kinase PrkA [Polyangiaceae bacterium]|nr:serine protein kinase PrkA [Polyangiaceae bacterium]